MPNIREFESREAQRGISPEGVTRGANAMIDLGRFQQNAQEDIGRRIGGAVENIGGAIEANQNDKQQAQTEIMQGSAALATMRVNIDDQWSEYVRQADPGDPNLRVKFWNENVKPQIEKFTESFQTEDGRLWAGKAVAGYAESAATGFAADVANLSASNTILNLQTAVNQNTIAIARSPHTLPEQLSGLRGFVHAAVVTSMMDPKKKAQVETELYQKYARQYVDAAMNGLINNDPVAALQYFQSGQAGKDFGGLVEQSDIDGWATAAETAHKSAVTSAETARKKVEDEKKRLSASTRYNRTMSAFDAASGQWAFTPDIRKAIIDDPNMSNEDKQGALKFLSENTGKNAADSDSPGLEAKLIQSIAAGDVDSTKLLEYLNPDSAEHLTPSTYYRLSKLTDETQEAKDQFSALRTAQLKSATSKVNPSMGFGVPNIQGAGGDIASAEMEADVSLRLSKAPDLATQMLMLTPGKKEYIFTPEYIDQYQRRAAEIGPTPIYIPGKAIGGGSTTPTPDGTTNPTGGGVLENQGLQGVPPPPANRRSLNEIFNGSERGSIEPATVQQVDFSFMGDAGRQIQANMVSFTNAAPAVSEAVNQPTPSGKSVPVIASENHKSPIDVSIAYLGSNERDHTEVIADFIKTNAGIDINPAKTAWCAAWVNAVLGASGYAGNGKLNARSFETYGEDVTTLPKEGDIAVFWRKSATSGLGHVGFFMGFTEDGKYVRVLGGNQDNQVSITLEPVNRLLSVRRIPGYKAVA